MISIIVPCYNSAAFVARTLASVRAQTLADWECVIVDDGSTDLSAEVVAAHIAGEPRMKLVRQPNGGVCNARNNGFKACSAGSKYLLFLDADDVIAPEMLEEMSKYLEARPSVTVAFCDYRHINDKDQAIPTPRIPRLVPTTLGLCALPDTSTPTPFVSIFAGALVLPSFSLLRRSAYEEAGGWDEWLGQHHEELDLFCRMALRASVHFVARPMGFYRRHEGQSSQEAGADERRARRLAEQARKLNQKWSDIAHLQPSQQRVVRRAQRFVQRRVAPHARMRAASEFLQRGQVYPAARLCLGALIRYVGWVK